MRARGPPGRGDQLRRVRLRRLGGTAEYAGDLTSFPATYALGVGTWDPDGSGPGQVKSYQVTLDLDASAGNSEQNQSITALTFTWEVQR